jgi:WD40 repeat protein
VCKTNGELDVLRRGAVILHRSCPPTKSPTTMAVVQGDYVALAENGALVASRGGEMLEIQTPIHGEYELALSSEGTIALADYSPGGTTWYVPPGGGSLEAGPAYTSRPCSVASDGNLAAWGYADGTVIVLDTVTGMTWKLGGHSGAVYYTVIDAAHARVVSGGKRELRVWDLKQPPTTLIKTMPCTITDLDPSPDGRLAALGCNDGSVWTWTRDTGTVTRIQRHVGMSYGVQWLKGMICSGGWLDGRVLCSAPDGSNLQTIDPGESRISWLTASLNHDYLVFASADGKIWRWDGKLQELYSHNAVPERMAISPDGRVLASCALDGSFAVFDLVNNRLVTHLTGHVGAAYNVAWLRDELWTTGDDGALKRWGFRNGAVTLRQRLQAPAAVHRLRVAQGGWAAVAGEGTVLASRDGDSVALQLDIGKPIEALDVSPDLRYVAAGMLGEIVVIDLQRSAIAALTVGFPEAKQLSFLDPTTLEFSDTATLKTLQVDRLDYVPFQTASESAGSAP